MGIQNHKTKNLPFLDFHRLLMWHWEAILTQETREFNYFGICLRLGYIFPQIDWTMQCILLLYQYCNTRSLSALITPIAQAYIYCREKRNAGPFKLHTRSSLRSMLIRNEYGSFNPSILDKICLQFSPSGESTTTLFVLLPATQTFPFLSKAIPLGSRKTFSSLKVYICCPVNV